MIRALLILCVLAPIPVAALEPLNALDDAFSMPLPGRHSDGVALYPGAETGAHGPFAVAGRMAPFGMDELSVATGIAGYGSGSLGMSAQFSGSGFDLYGEESARLGAAWRPVSWLSAGARVSRSAMRIDGFGSAACWSGDMGVVISPRADLVLAGAVEDVFGAELGESKEPLDGRSRFSAAWGPPGPVTLLGSVSKVRRFDASLTGGFMADIADALTIGAAACSEPDRYEFLCGVKVRGLRISWRGNWHPALGMSQGVSAAWYGSIREPDSPRP